MNNFVQKKLKKEFYKESGEHAWVVGTSGSGKTDFMIELLKGFKHHVPNETIIWRDYGKESETLALLQYYPIVLFHPKGTTFDYKLTKKQKDFLPFELTQVEFETTEELLDSLQKKAINVISMRRYLRKPHLFTRFWSNFFINFIDYALDAQLPRPLTFFIDEMNNITPSDRHFFTEKQATLTNLIVYNIQNLRATQNRLLPSSQNPSSLNKGIRTQIQWYFFKRCNESISTDIGHFVKAQAWVQALRRDQIIIAGPSREFSDPISFIPKNLPNVDENLLPKIDYGGQFKFKEEEKKADIKQENIELKMKIAKELKSLGKTKKEIADFIGMSMSQVDRYIHDRL